MKLGRFSDSGDPADWKAIQGYEDYLVNNQGEVYSVRRKKKLKPAMDRYGYLYYVLCVDSARKTVKAHRLVAQAFIENPQNKPTVNHKNGIRHDNRAENLEWATARDQAHDERTYQNTLRVAAETDYRAMGAQRNFGRRKTAVYKGDELLGVYESLKAAADATGANFSKASMCANGQRKTAGGMRFCFV